MCAEAVGSNPLLSMTAGGCSREQPATLAVLGSTCPSNKQTCSLTLHCTVLQLTQCIGIHLLLSQTLSAGCSYCC